MPLNLNTNEVTGVDLNNTEVSEVRLNGQTVFSAGGSFDIQDYPNQLSTFTNVSTLQDFHINESGTKFFYAERNGLVEEYDLQTPYDLNTANLNQQINTGNSDLTALELSPDGTKLYYADLFGALEQFTLQTPFDISSRSADGTNNFSGRRQQFFVSENGDFLYGADNDSSGEVYSLEATTPFDFTNNTTLTKISSFEDDPRGASINPDGTKFYEGGFENRVYQFELTTPFDITTKTNRVERSTSSPTNYNVYFANNGEFMYLSGTDGTKQFGP